MKKVFFISILLVSIICFKSSALGIDTSTTPIPPNVDSIKKEIKTIEKNLSIISKKIQETEAISFGEGVIIALPEILFLLLFFYFMNWLKKDNYKLADALSADSTDSFFKTTDTKQDSSDPTKTITTINETPNYARSSSRVIAFLTGVTALVISLTIMTLYTYSYITGKEKMDLDGLWKIIAGLGIGVVPYVSKTIKGTTI